jgi:hypothetical protein
MISDHTVAASVYFSGEMFKDVDARNKVCEHKILSPPSYEKCMLHIHGLPAEASMAKLHGEIASEPSCPPPSRLLVQWKIPCCCCGCVEISGTC